VLVPAAVVELAEQTGANVVAVNDSWVTEGPSFGSANVVRFNAPKVAMAWDEPTTAYSAGNTRFVVERQFDYPVTPIRVDRLRNANLSRYRVLILPLMSGGEYEPELGEQGIENIKDWVRDGGVIIGLGNATRFLADPDVDLLAVRRERAVVELEDVPDEDDDEEATVGAGQVISFTQDPTVRAYLDGLNVILMSAIFRGAAHARPPR